MIEKLLPLHFMYESNMKDQNTQKIVFHEMESTLSIGGVHKGKGKIFKDSKHLGTRRVSNKPSMNGAHVNLF